MLTSFTATPPAAQGMGRERGNRLLLSESSSWRGAPVLMAGARFAFQYVWKILAILNVSPVVRAKVGKECERVFTWARSC